MASLEFTDAPFFHAQEPSRKQENAILFKTPTGKSFCALNLTEGIVFKTTQSELDWVIENVGCGGGHPTILIQHGGVFGAAAHDRHPRGRDAARRRARRTIVVVAGGHWGAATSTQVRAPERAERRARSSCSTRTGRRSRSTPAATQSRPNGATEAVQRRDLLHGGAHRPGREAGQRLGLVAVLAQPEDGQGRHRRRRDEHARDELRLRRHVPLAAPADLEQVLVRDRRSTRDGSSPRAPASTPGPFRLPTSWKLSPRECRSARSRANTASNDAGSSANARCSPPWVPHGRELQHEVGRDAQHLERPARALVREAEHARVEVGARRGVVHLQDQVVERAAISRASRTAWRRRRSRRGRRTGSACRRRRSPRPRAGSCRRWRGSRR